MVSHLILWCELHQDAVEEESLKTVPVWLLGKWMEMYGLAGLWASRRLGNKCDHGPREPQANFGNFWPRMEVC